MIKISNLRMSYASNDDWRIDSLDLTIADGRIFGLLGPNGVGKTTILKMVSGLLRPMSGTIEINGRDVFSDDEIKREIGLVPQELAVYQKFTLRENLVYIGRMWGLRGAELKSRVEECIGIANLEDSADRQVRTYSGGMMRRANLVLSMIHHPRILILDEPTVGIDAQARNSILSTLREINRVNGMTVVYATHYMEEAQQLCNEVAVLDHGKIIVQGNPAELIESNPGCRDLQDLYLKLTGRNLRD